MGLRSWEVGILFGSLLATATCRAGDHELPDKARVTVYLEKARA
jgi:hypothetical protein